MRTRSSYLVFPALLLVGLVGCSFRMQAGSAPQRPTASGNQTQPTPQPTPVQPTPAQPARPPKVIAGNAKAPRPTPPSTPPAAPPSTPPPAGAAVVSGSTVFGGSTVDPAGLKGSIFFLNAGATAMPDLAKETAKGFLFTSTLNVSPQAFTSGFPGVDAARKENFAIRYEGPLVVGTEADYDFRVVAEDGAKLLIDGTVIVDNDGVKTGPTEKTAPVHLVAATHVLTVDYLQTTGNVALQVFCKKAGGTEQVCPTRLP